MVYQLHLHVHDDVVWEVEVFGYVDLNIGAVMIDACVELLCCAANILFFTLGTRNEVDYICGVAGCVCCACPCISDTFTFNYGFEDV